MTSPQPWNGATKLPLGQLIVSTAGNYYWIVCNQFDHPNPTTYHVISCVGFKQSILPVNELRRHYLICPICKPEYEGLPLVGEIWAPVVPWRHEILRIERVPDIGDICCSVTDATNNTDRSYYALRQYYHPVFFRTFYRPFKEAKEMNFGI